jgi:hypothetical protein
MRVAALLLVSAALAAAAEQRTHRIEYVDLPPAVRSRLAGHGIDQPRFPEYLRHIEAETSRRLQEGQRDHFIYYALQSQRFTRLPRIEPALSARSFVERLPDVARRRLLADRSYLPAAGFPERERARVEALLRSIESAPGDPWLIAFRDLVPARDGLTSADAFYPDYVRVARFLYRKEFVAAVDSASAAATARLYEDRPHSADTRVEAGFAMYVGLASLRALDPALRLPQVLIVGPGLDFAPRTGLIDSVAPQSYQPFAVADALLSLSLASPTDLRVHSVDINPRVVHWLETLSPKGVTLHLITGTGADRRLLFRDDYRTYLQNLGRSIGADAPGPRALATDPRYVRSIAVRPDVVRLLGATRLNVLTERMTSRSGFDLIIVTNVLTYFDDPQLDVALANLAAMLRPGGYLLHNESRQGLAETAAAIGVPALHMRTAVIGGPSERPLYDVIWIHQRSVESPAGDRDPRPSFVHLTRKEGSRWTMASCSTPIRAR